MIKRIIVIVVITSILFVGCSKKNDDDVQDVPITDLKIQKLIDSNEISDYNYVQYFNENGTLHKELDFLYNQTEVGRSYRLFEYNSELQLTSIKLYSGSDVFIREEQAYSYNAQGKLVSRIDYGDGAHPPYHTAFTYQGNRIDFFETETNRGGYFIFDSNNRIMETSHDSGGGVYIFQYLTYENGTLKEIRINQNLIYRYTIDENPNPLYRNFISNSMQHLLERHFLYDIDFTSEAYLFANNVTKVTKDVSGNMTDYKTTTFQYNDSNFPISSSTLRNSGAIVNRIYEYY